jgi:copper transport protein
MRRAIASVVAAWLLLAVSVPCVSAHALPQSSNPSPGSSLPQAPTQVSIVFGERPDLKLSSINVLDSSGASMTSGPTVAAPDNANELLVPLKPLPAGVYTVSWRTVSAVDGHTTAGSFAFGVGGAAPSSAPGGDASGGLTISGPSGGAVVARWLLFVGLIVLLGASLFGVAIAGPAAFGARRLVPLAWLLAAIGTVGVVVEQLSDAGVALDAAFSTSFGPEIVERLVALSVAGIGVAGVLIRRSAAKPFLATAGLAAAGAMFADVDASHAAAGALPILSVAIQWVHVTAVGAWLGGLAGLLLATRRPPGPETAILVRRFSWVGTIGIATVALTGLLRAISEVGTLTALTSTDFGRLVIAKMVLLGGLGLLGAINHFVNMPAAGRRLRGLRLAGSGELMLGATLVLISASLVNLAPPVEAGGPGGSGAGSPSPAPTEGPLVVTGSDFGTSVRLSLAISPGVAGFNTFTAQVTDFDTGQPVAATGLTMRFSLPARPDIGSSRLDLSPTGAGEGTFSGTGPNLSIAGTWSVSALVVNGVSSVEVQLSVTTRCPATSGPAPVVTVNAAPGQPTLYTAALSGGRSVQIYLDPGSPGANEEHVTFFDASGNELPVETVTMSIGPSSCIQSALEPRQLEPGHFVADTTLPAGTYTTSISGPAPNGDQLSIQLGVTVK